MKMNLLNFNNDLSEEIKQQIVKSYNETFQYLYKIILIISKIIILEKVDNQYSRTIWTIYNRSKHGLPINYIFLAQNNLEFIVPYDEKIDESDLSEIKNDYYLKGSYLFDNYNIIDVRGNKTERIGQTLCIVDDEELQSILKQFELLLDFEEILIRHILLKAESPNHKKIYVLTTEMDPKVKSVLTKLVDEFNSK